MICPVILVPHLLATGGSTCQHSRAGKITCSSQVEYYAFLYRLFEDVDIDEFIAYRGPILTW
jgi:hypothetical protein